ncbi:uncharacterized protein LOC125496792 [Beta vulgaris subsp. vulgaris]|uniref:uncharacterized protein LOC125496792 n=1 Tax=Beta vulgaris subsp. vulgaris TaxID=3555 RepID=UPI00203716CA|nr:uncharacterized protein LOC125496792 [Beta vulgaris subsp. vulgaris]
MAANEESTSNNSQSNNNVSLFYNDPYYISSSDNTVSKIVPINLNGNNFLSWKRNVKRALMAKNKLGFLDGSIKKPDVADKDFSRWMRSDYLVTCWLMNSMDADIADNFTYVDNSEQLWYEVCERFGQTNGSQIYQLKKELDNLRQDNMSVVVYFGKMKKCWDELQNLRTFPTCSCGLLAKCSCNFMKKLIDFDAEEKLMQFLLGLNSSFENGKGHTKDQCFKIIGYPDWYNPKKNNKIGGKVAANVTAIADCEYEDTPLEFRSAGPGGSSCASPGAVMDSGMVNTIVQEVMRSLKGKQQNSGDSSAYAHSARVNKCDQMIAGEPYAHNAGKVPVHMPDSSSWIIDSGATDHMTHDASLFCRKRRLNKVFEVGLPDGNCSYVHEVGDVMLKCGIMLTNVLLVPTFTYDLLSIGQLLVDGKVHVEFTTTECIFSHSNSHQILAKGQKIRGLYFLISNALSSSVKPSFHNSFASHTSTSNLHIMHARLGHVSLSKMKHIPEWYKLYNLDTHKVFVSRDVIFREDVFPFNISQSSSNTNAHMDMPTVSYDSPIHFTTHDTPTHSDASNHNYEASNNQSSPSHILDNHSSSASPPFIHPNNPPVSNSDIADDSFSPSPVNQNDNTLLLSTNTSIADDSADVSTIHIHTSSKNPDLTSKTQIPIRQSTRIVKPPTKF